MLRFKMTLVCLAVVYLVLDLVENVRQHRSFEQITKQLEVINTNIYYMHERLSATESVLNSYETRFFRDEEKLHMVFSAVDVKDFRLSAIKKIRNAVNATFEEFNYERTLNTKELTEFATAIAKANEEFDIPVALLLAMARKESAFNPKALSSANARGLIQIIPETAEEISRQLDQKHYDMYKISDNVRFSAFYIMTLMDRYGGRVETVLQAYNCGPVCVSRVKSGQYKSFPDETKNYTKMILSECVKTNEDNTCAMKGFRKYYEDLGL